MPAVTLYRVAAHFHFQGNLAIPDQVQADPIGDSQEH
jgi:hypothetical protein